MRVLLERCGAGENCAVPVQNGAGLLLQDPVLFKVRRSNLRYLDPLCGAVQIGAGPVCFVRGQLMKLYVAQTDLCCLYL